MEKSNKYWTKEEDKDRYVYFAEQDEVEQYRRECIEVQRFRHKYRRKNIEIMER